MYGRSRALSSVVVMLALQGCSIATLLERTTDGIDKANRSMQDTNRSIAAMGADLRRLQPSMDRLGALEVPLREAAQLGVPLSEIALLRQDLAEVAAMRADLTALTGLRKSAESIKTLEPTLDELVALRPALEHLIETGDDVTKLYELRDTLQRISRIETQLTPLITSIDRVERVRVPLDRVSLILERMFKTLLPLLEAPVWQLILGALVVLIALGFAVGLGVYAAVRLANRQTAARRRPPDGVTELHEAPSSMRQ